MFIDQETLKRVNIDAPYKGRSKLDTPEIRAACGVIEIADPVRGDDNLFYNQEIDDAPYLIVTPKPAEMIEAARVAKLDQQILALEKQAIEQGLIRTIIDDLLIRSLQIAAAANPPVTEAELIDPESPNYSRAYHKVHTNAAARAILRSQR
jgi:hypothetical protein